MFKPGDIIRHKDKNFTIKFQVYDIDIYNWYKLQVTQEDLVNFPHLFLHAMVSWHEGNLFVYEQDIKPIELDNIPIYGIIKPKEHDCQCGAYTVGYTKQGKAHSYYCNMNKEE